jgi:hypothetical protein
MLPGFVVQTQGIGAMPAETRLKIHAFNLTGAGRKACGTHQRAPVGKSLSAAHANANEALACPMKNP